MQQLNKGSLEFLKFCKTKKLVSSVGSKLKQIKTVMLCYIFKNCLAIISYVIFLIDGVGLIFYQYMILYFSQV